MNSRNAFGQSVIDTVPREPSAWLRARVAQRLRAVAALGLDPYANEPCIIAPLGTSGPPGSREDRACDRCGEYVDSERALMCFIVTAAAGLRLCGGLCETCWALEGCPSGGVR